MDFLTREFESGGWALSWNFPSWKDKEKGAKKKRKGKIGGDPLSEGAQSNKKGGGGVGPNSQKMLIEKGEEVKKRGTAIQKACQEQGQGGKQKGS